MLLLFLSHELSALIDWLIFKDERIWLVSLNFTHSTLFTACADQLSYSLSLIKWCTACVKQNTAVKTAIDAFSLLAKYTFSDLVGEPASSIIINFEQVVEPFLVLNIFFTFFLSVVDNTFCKSTIKGNKCRFENLPISQSSYENNMLKISY